jgi:hypothetical protein
MVTELKQRNRNIKEKKLLNKDEVYHGALEDILLGKLCCNYLVWTFTPHQPPTEIKND